MGLSMEKAIAQWLIKEGDSFNKGDEICEIETTKIVNVRKRLSKERSVKF